MNTSYEKLSFFNNFFSGTIDGDNIVSTDLYGNKTLVGVTIKKYQDTLNLLNDYYDKLIELGVIEKEKTPEEVAKEQQEMMQTMMLQMKAMQEKLDNIQKSNNDNNIIIKDKEDGYESNTEFCYQEIEHESGTTEQPDTINRKGKRDIKFSKQPNGCFG